MVVSLHMGWRHVLFANWPVDPVAIDPQVPDSLTLDTYDGRAWLSVIPFVNVDVRPQVLPDGWGVSLPEINLRTYVTCDGEPGVYFFSLDAEGISAVLGARVTHHLPYYYARMDLEFDRTPVRFESRRLHPGARPARFEATYGPDGERFEADPGSLAHFLTERHRLFTEDPRGRVRYTAVEHAPWPLYDATVEIDRNTMFDGKGFDHPETDPVHLYSPGVDTVAAPSKVWDPGSA